MNKKRYLIRFEIPLFIVHSRQKINMTLIFILRFDLSDLRLILLDLIAFGNTLKGVAHKGIPKDRHNNDHRHGQVENLFVGREEACDGQNKSAENCDDSIGSWTAAEVEGSLFLPLTFPSAKNPAAIGIVIERYMNTAQATANTR